MLHCSRVSGGDPVAGAGVFRRPWPGRSTPLSATRHGRRRPVAGGAVGGYFAGAAASGKVQAITLSPALVSIRSWPPIAATMYCLPLTV